MLFAKGETRCLALDSENYLMLFFLKIGENENPTRCLKGISADTQNISAKDIRHINVNDIRNINAPTSRARYVQFPVNLDRKPMFVRLFEKKVKKKKDELLPPSQLVEGSHDRPPGYYIKLDLAHDKKGGGTISRLFIKNISNQGNAKESPASISTRRRKTSKNQDDKTEIDIDIADRGQSEHSHSKLIIPAPLTTSTRKRKAGNHVSIKLDNQGDEIETGTDIDAIGSTKSMS
jgi:hypothetical protein